MAPRLQFLEVTMLVIGYDKTQDLSQALTLPAGTSTQQAANALRNAGIEPDILWPVDLQAGQPSLQNTFRKGTDYQ